MLLSVGFVVTGLGDSSIVRSDSCLLKLAFTQVTLWGIWEPHIDVVADDGAAFTTPADPVAAADFDWIDWFWFVSCIWSLRHCGSA
jgi:hypothetical protein